MNAFVLVAVLGLAAPAAAQGGPSFDLDLSPTMEAEATADRLQAEAFAMFEDRGKWGQAARLLVRSAQLREENDPARAKGYSLAAQLYAHTGNLEHSQRSFEKAAASSEKVGAVVDAAIAHVNAAEIALRRGDAETVRAHIHKAMLLSESPHLDEAERRAIADRLPRGADVG